MSIATDILKLRQNQASSVTTLIALLDWQKQAYDIDHMMSRGYAVREAADLVLLNVAAHVAEALSEPPSIRIARRTVSSFWRKRRPSDTPQLRQHRLFAPTVG